MPRLSELCHFIDLHTHILPGLDDGAKDLVMSLEMGRLYAESGIQRVVATPHFVPGTAWSATKEVILERMALLQKELLKAGIDLTLYPGMEIAFHRKLAKRLQEGTLLPLGTSRHYLIEPAFREDQSELCAVLWELADDGFSLIIAHPERIQGFQQKIDLLAELVDHGLQLQVNTGSFYGAYGKAAMQTAHLLAAEGLIHYVASDAHNAAKRPPVTFEEWGILLVLDREHGFLERCLANAEKLMDVKKEHL